MEHQAKSTRKQTITTDDWLAELGRLYDKASDAGETVDEISMRVGRNHQWVRRALYAAREQSRLHVGKRQQVALDGRRYMATVYRILPAKKGKRK